MPVMRAFKTYNHPFSARALLSDNEKEKEKMAGQGLAVAGGEEAFWSWCNVFA